MDAFPDAGVANANVSDARVVISRGTRSSEAAGGGGPAEDMSDDCASVDPHEVGPPLASTTVGGAVRQ